MVDHLSSTLGLPRANCESSYLDCGALFRPHEVMALLDLVEASIDELQAALSAGTLTSVELVALYLCRIGRYDIRGPKLNSIPIINPDVFEEAAASDDHRVSGQPIRPLEGIPYTVKDSFKVAGMTVAAGSPAFRNLVANEDAFSVAAIRAAGGVLIGRTNMPAMAYGGMQRGIYGRAESPYNKDYLAAAFGSGSSNGSAVATAASFAAFGMGEETVSSGRSPASNNGLVAYTPSRGCLSIRGNWPLYPTCDVVVPHTRTMKDMLALLDVITQPDEIADGDFWRHQPFVNFPAKNGWPEKPDSFKDMAAHSSLNGLRVAVPVMYIGGLPTRSAEPVCTSDAVIELWNKARSDLEALGAQVVIVDDFPAVTGYENNQLLPDDCPRLPDSWASMERGQLVAHAWNDFLQANGDSILPDIAAVDTSEIYPDRLRTAPELRYLAPANNIHFSRLAEYVKTKPLYQTNDIAEALKTLETMRKRLFDDYLAAHNCDCFAFPAAGDVGRADADSNHESAAHAWQNGVKYSNGNRAIRHLGIPTVSVPMGILADKKMPVNLTFAGRAYDDVRLLKWANAFEITTLRRIAPERTPALPEEARRLNNPATRSKVGRPKLYIEYCDLIYNGDGDSSTLTTGFQIRGKVHVPRDTPGSSGSSPFNAEGLIEVYVNGHEVRGEGIRILETGDEGIYELFVDKKIALQGIKAPNVKTEAHVTIDKVMVVILARSERNGRPSGWVGLL